MAFSSLAPLARSCSLLSLAAGSSQAVSFRHPIMLHTGVVVFGLCSVSFVGGICFTLFCLSAKACCQVYPSMGTKDTTEKSTRKSEAKHMSAKRTRPEGDDAGSLHRLQPSAKRPKSEGDMERGADTPKVVTVPWPLPRN